MGLSLRANFSWTFVGNVVYAASQWGIIVLLTKLGSAEMVGQFALGMAITAPIIMFAKMQLRGIQATDANKEFEFGHYLSLRSTTSFLSLLVTLGVIIFAGYRRETAIVILLVGVAKAIEAISDVIYGLLQQNEQMDRIAKSMMIKGPMTLAAVGLGVYFGGTLVWGVIGLVLTWMVILVGYDYRSGLQVLRVVMSHGSAAAANHQTPQIELRRQWPILLKLAKMALPLGLVMVFISLNSNIPRYFVEHYWGEGELGIFASIAYLMVAGRTVIGALGQSASPRLAKHYANGRLRAFRSLFIKLIGIAVLVGAAGILVAVSIGEELLALLYQPEYARRNILILLMIVASISYIASFFGYGLTAVRYFRVQLPLTVIVASTTTLISFWLIPQFGLHGAALALIGGATVQVILSFPVLRHALRTQSLSNIKRNVA